MKNNIDVFYFSVLIPLNIFFVEDGKMGKIITHDFMDQHPVITPSLHIRQVAAIINELLTIQLCLTVC